MPEAFEVNFDGLVGPTHNYAGLAHGNLAAMRHRATASNPRQAALQGLRKMKLFSDLGTIQGVLPPQERPDIGALRRLGFHGEPGAILAQAQRQAPRLLAACASASGMWAANAATVSPSADAGDGRVHFTPANLASHLHRSLEAPTTALILRRIFPDESVFAHHPPLPGAPPLCDEGAANHMRLAAAHGQPGIEFYVYGHSTEHPASRRPGRFQARQTLEASAAVARLHRLDSSRVLFVQQHPEAIDAGVFHNDVAAVGHLNVLLYHARAFRGRRALVARLRRWFAANTPCPFIPIEVPELAVPLSDAVHSYLFNSQLISANFGSGSGGGGGMTLIAPAECRRIASTRRWLEGLANKATPIRRIQFVDIRQSMKNGGGPACLRLRVVLTEAQLKRIHQGVLLTPTLFEALTAWINRHYRDRLLPRDLGDPQLLREGYAALEDLTRLLGLGPIYPFQR